MEAKVVPEGLLQKKTSIGEIILLDEPENIDNERIRAHAFNPNATLRIFLSTKASRREDQQLAANIRRADCAARNVFKTFDLNGDGTIAVSELNNLAEALERQKVLSRSAIAQMLEQFKKDGSMELSFHDFKKFFHRYNQERLAEHKRESLEMRKHLSGLHDTITVSASKKCGSMCLGTIKTGCCVYHKQLLLLASMAAMAAMVPLLGIAYTVRHSSWQSIHYIISLRVIPCRHTLMET